MAKIEFTRLDQATIGQRQAIIEQMRKPGFTPVRTGRLKKSIKPEPLVDTPNGIQAPISYVSYGVYPDFGTKFQSAQEFSIRAIKAVNKSELDELAEAAMLDINDAILDTLPPSTQVTTTL